MGGWLGCGCMPAPASALTEPPCSCSVLNSNVLHVWQAHCGMQCVCSCAWLAMAVPRDCCTAVHPTWAWISGPLPLPPYPLPLWQGPLFVQPAFAPDVWAPCGALKGLLPLPGIFKVCLAVPRASLFGCWVGLASPNSQLPRFPVQVFDQ